MSSVPYSQLRDEGASVLRDEDESAVKEQVELKDEVQEGREGSLTARPKKHTTRQRELEDKCIVTLGGPVYSVAFSSTDTRVVCGDASRKVTVLEASSGEVVWEKQLGGVVTSVAFSLTDTKVVCGDFSYKVTILNLCDDVLLERYEETVHRSRNFNLLPRLSMILGVSSNGRGVAAMMAKVDDFAGVEAFVHWLQQNCTTPGEHALASWTLCSRDVTHKSAVQYVMDARKGDLLQSLLDYLLASAHPLIMDMMADAYLTNIAQSYAPLLYRTLCNKPLLTYPHSGAPRIRRCSAALLEADHSRLCLKGSEVDCVMKRFWEPDIQAGADDEVDVTCGILPLQGISRSNNSIFATIVEGASLQLISIEPVRAVIAFKWAAYGRCAWLGEVGWYVALVASFLGSVSALLFKSAHSLSDDDDGADVGITRHLIGVALASVCSAINLTYVYEEFKEVRSQRFVYFASLTNWMDAALHGLVMALVPLAMLTGIEGASSSAAVATVLLFFKGQKVLRGNEGMSFLVNMLFEILVDMRAFMFIQLGAIIASAVAYRLLLGDVEAYGNSALSLYSSYALLMYAEGVGETDLYMSRQVICATWLHALRVKETSQREATWSGRLQALKSKLDCVEDTMSSKVAAVDHEVKAVHHKVVSIEQKLDQLVQLHSMQQSTFVADDVRLVKIDASTKGD
ncbi:MAG: hypothetical protein SGPRY_013062 [Prymnesium sp.]